MGHLGRVGFSGRSITTSVVFRIVNTNAYSIHEVSGLTYLHQWFTIHFFHN